MIANPDPSNYDSFGGAVASGGKGVLVVGAQTDDFGAENAGSVYVFDPSDGALLATIRNPLPDTGDHFGSTICLAGDNILVGTPRDDAGAFFSGSAYLFDGDPASPGFGSLLRTFVNPSPASGAQFGDAVAATADLLVIAAPAPYYPSTGNGKVYVFGGNMASPSFGSLLLTLAPPFPLAPDIYFGYGCAIDGSVIAVSAYSSNGPWQREGLIRLFDGNPQSPSFGGLLRSIVGLAGSVAPYGGELPLALDSGRLIMGSRHATLYGVESSGVSYLFDSVPASSRFGELALAVSNPAPNEIMINDYFGAAVALNGPFAAIGATGDIICNELAGSVYVYDADTASSSTGCLLRVINHPDPNFDADFGTAIAPIGSSSFAIGAPRDKLGSTYGAGAVYIFEAGPALTPTPSLTPSLSPTISNTPTISLTPSLSLTASRTPTQSFTPTPTLTPTPPPPVILRQPASLVVRAGQAASFSIEAAGIGPLSYAWRKDGFPSPVSTSPVYAIEETVSSDAGSYSCAVGSPWGAALSAAGTFAVLDASAPNSAKFVASSIPSQIEAGQEIFIGIMMKNTSAMTWSVAQGYTLAVTRDPGGVFQGVTRIYAADPAAWVVPAVNGLAHFVAAIRAPASPGVYTALVRMVEENVEFFGEEASLSVNVVATINAARDWREYD